MLARMARQQPRGPQFVWIAQFLRLAAGQRHQPGPGLGGDRRLLARSRTIIESRHGTISQRPRNAALHRLMMHPQSATHREKRWVFPVRQQNLRPLDPARRLRSRTRYRNQPRQILISNRQLNRLPPCRHDLPPPLRIRSQGTSHDGPRESRANDWFHGIDELVYSLAGYEPTREEVIRAFKFYVQ